VFGTGTTRKSMVDRLPLLPLGPRPLRLDSRINPHCHDTAAALSVSTTCHPSRRLHWRRQRQLHHHYHRRRVCSSASMPGQSHPSRCHADHLHRRCAAVLPCLVARHDMLRVGISVMDRNQYIGTVRGDTISCHSPSTPLSQFPRQPNIPHCHDTTPALSVTTSRQPSRRLHWRRHCHPHHHRRRRHVCSPASIPQQSHLP
jgi:hypothetical protein